MARVQRTDRQRRDRAMVAVNASKKTRDILPRIIYKRAGVEVPAGATDEIQRGKLKDADLKKFDDRKQPQL